MTRHRERRLSIRRLGMLAGLAAMVIYGANCGAAGAQTYPDRPIKLVVPFGAGGPPDVAARIVGDYVSAHLGTVFVENRPGAGGTIAAKAVAATPPDGYTLLLATSGVLSISSQLYPDPGYDPVTSFAPIALISTAPLVLAVNPQMPIHNIADLVAYAKANPGKLNFGASIGTPPHISGEMFKVLTGTRIVFVPYKTAAAAASDAIAGQIQMTFQGTTGIMPFIQTGQLRPIGVVSPRRIPELSDVPTMAEQGITGMPPDAWQGIVAPAGTPAEIIAKLNGVINEGLADSQLKAGIIRLGGSPKLTSPAEFASFIATMKEEWAKVIKASGVTIN
ncbi:MAG: tripartite tricarboxylate transporter substrate binding protein [Xanthobacteraceae bacterium]